MSGKEADQIARDLIAGRGYGDNFGHGLGHGLGRQVHDGGGLSQRIDLTLVAGMVMTVEPGFGGQEFMRDAARKIVGARDLLSYLPLGGEVHVDGGINRETAEIVGAQGTDILVVGSALWIKGHDMAREIRLIRALADEGYQYGLNDGVPPIPRLVAAGVRRLVVAGGETSGAVVQALGVRTLRIGPAICPGVPWTLAQDQPLKLALKSGNFGGPDFFAEALAHEGAV